MTYSIASVSVSHVFYPFKLLCGFVIILLLLVISSTGSSFKSLDFKIFLVKPLCGV